MVSFKKITLSALTSKSLEVIWKAREDLCRGYAFVKENSDDAKFLDLAIRHIDIHMANVTARS